MSRYHLVLKIQKMLAKFLYQKLTNSLSVEKNIQIFFCFSKMINKHQNNLQ